MRKLSVLKTLLSMVEELRDRVSALVDLVHGVEIDDDFKTLLIDEVGRPMESALINIEECVKNLRDLVDSVDDQ